MTKRGYKQTPEHIAARIRRGKDHPNWQGDGVSVRGGRSRALRLFREIGPCVSCGSPRSERHHRDGNTANNRRTNIIILCRRCHMKADGRLEALPHSNHAGEHNGRAVLTAADVRDIRRLRSEGVPRKLLASRYGLSTNSIHRIVTRRAWRHVT